MAANPENQYYTFQEYLTMLQNGERRLEYDHGEIYAMAGSSPNHVRISFNMCRALDDALGEETTCVTYMMDRVVEVAEEVNFMPDVVVSCSEGDHEDFILEAPRLVVEVLSRSTEARDRTYKLIRYQANEHIQEIVLISQYVQQVEVITRTATSWDYHKYGYGQQFPLSSLDVTIAVADVYRRLSIPTKSDQSEDW
jgi:Uma2 family endonuclease